MNALNKKLFVGAGALAALLVGLLVTLELTQRRQIVQKKAVEATASLSLSPSSGSYNKGQQFAVNIFLDTGGKNVVGVDVSLNFDAEKLQATQVTPGNVFQGQIIFKNEVSGNKILLSLGSFTPYSGSGVYGTIQFTGKAVGSAAVSFDPSPSSKVSGQGTGDILGQVASSSYEITEAVSTPTPTPTQISIPTPTSSPVPSSTPTSGVGGPPTATVTPLPSPTRAPNPTATPTVKSGIGGPDQVRVTSTPSPQVPPASPTPTLIQLPVTSFSLPSILVIFTGILLMISALVLL